MTHVNQTVRTLYCIRDIDFQQLDPFLDEHADGLLLNLEQGDKHVIGSIMKAMDEIPYGEVVFISTNIPLYHTMLEELAGAVAHLQKKVTVKIITSADAFKYLAIGRKQCLN